MLLRVACILAIAFAGLVGPAAAAAPTGNPSPFGRQVSAEVKHDLGPALRDAPPAPRTVKGPVTIPVRRLPAPTLTNPAGEAVTPGTGAATTAAAPATSNNFEGVGQGFTGPQGAFLVNAAPPDTNGSVGPNHYVQIVNTDFAIFNKTGTVLFGPVPVNTLWSGFGGGCQTNNDGDPSAVYDRMADRWVITQFSVSTTPFLECVAVSQTADPTGAYFRYAFSYTDFPDYPKLSVWPDAYYVTYNMFNAAGTVFVGGQVCALNRSNMLNGAPATQQCFNLGTGFGGLLASTLDGPRVPPVGSPNYVVALGATNTTLASWNFHVDWVNIANTTLTGPTAITVDSFAQACGGGTCIPQPGTTQQLDSLGDRLMYRLAYRNFGDHEALVANHSITLGTSVGVRWYELRPSAGALSLFQQGTYAPDASDRWMGSAAMDQAGDIALGYSVSSPTLHPGIRYTARLASDPLGQMTQGEGSIIEGAGSQSGQALSRWGDYSNLAIDPSDDCTFWYTNEYEAQTGAFNWHTRIGSFKLANCGAPLAPNDFFISVAPTSLRLVQGNSGTAILSTATTNGAPQSVTLGVSGTPAGATASLSPTSVTSGGTSTVTINAGTAAAGTYSLTMTGTGTGATHSTTLTLVVNPPPPANDFSISVAPISLSLIQGSSGTATVSTTTTAGAAQSVSLTASGAPAGATASLSPTSVTSGGTSTVTVNAGTAAAGTYALMITGTGSAGPIHSTLLSLTVTPQAPPPTNGITNGGFETGNLSGWTAAGTAAVSTIAHSGGFSAMLGSTSPTNGDSSIAQTFTAPSAGGTLSFWYRVACVDSVSFDWATATLTDNTTATTTTLLPRTCNNNAAWVQVTASVAASHSYTLTLVSHDDNLPGNPTFTNYDDVAIQLATVGITNGGFETGDLSGWTTAGVAGVSPTSHTGSFSARVGSTTAFNGDSSITQTFVVPGGATQLVLWYRVVCTDTVTFDWATATLRDNTTGTTATVFSRTCTNNATWVQATAAVTAGHSYTLTLIDHDDGASADPTFTLYDDVGVQ